MATARTEAGDDFEMHTMTRETPGQNTMEDDTSEILVETLLEESRVSPEGAEPVSR